MLLPPAGLTLVLADLLEQGALGCGCGRHCESQLWAVVLLCEREGIFVNGSHTPESGTRHLRPDRVMQWAVIAIADVRVVHKANVQCTFQMSTRYLVQTRPPNVRSVQL